MTECPRWAVAPRTQIVIARTVSRTASLLFPTTSPRASDEVLLLCWPTPNRTELQTELPLRVPNLAARSAERMHSVPQWRGMQCGLDPNVGRKDIHAVWVLHRCWRGAQQTNGWESDSSAQSLLTLPFRARSTFLICFHLCEVPGKVQGGSARRGIQCVQEQTG